MRINKPHFKTFFKYFIVLMPVALLILFQISASCANKTKIKTQPDFLLANLIDNPIHIWKGGVEEVDRDRQITITKALYTHANDFFHNHNSPMVGPKNNTITLVEFFDYQCGHCRNMVPVLTALQKQNPNLKIIYKELPILDNNSTIAANAALAAHKQGKYIPFHTQLMQEDIPLSEDKILAVAEKVGLNIHQLKKDMDSDSVDTEILNNFKLAKMLTLTGTPVLLIVNEHPHNQEDAKSFFVSGDANLDLLQDLVNQAR